MKKQTKIISSLVLSILTVGCADDVHNLVDEEKTIARRQSIELLQERDHYKKRLRDEESYRIAQARDEENYRKQKNREFYEYQQDRQKHLDYLQDDKIAINNEGARLNNAAGFVNSVKDDYSTTRQKRRDLIDDVGRHNMNTAEAIKKANEYKYQNRPSNTIIVK